MGREAAVDLESAWCRGRFSRNDATFGPSMDEAGEPRCRKTPADSWDRGGRTPLPQGIVNLRGPESAGINLDVCEVAWGVYQDGLMPAEFGDSSSVRMRLGGLASFDRA